MTQKEELRERIEAKKKELEARIHEFKADSNAEQRKKANEMQSRLDELREKTRDGYDSLTESVAARLNELLKN